MIFVSPIRSSIPRGSAPAFTAMVAVVALSGCAAGSDFSPGPLPIAEAWRHQVAAPPPSPDWWAGAEDLVLTGLVEAALSDNLDIEAALARLDRARAAASGAQARRGVGGGLEVSASRTRQSLETAGPAADAPGYDRTTSAYGATLGPSWDADLAGGLRRAGEAAAYDAEGAAAGVEAARAAIVAETVQAYVALRSLQERRRLAGLQVETSTRLTSLVAQRHAAGLSSRLELEQARAADGAVRASLPQLEAGVEAQLNRLAVLTGQTVQSDRTALEAAAAAPDLHEPGLGAPGDLIRRRPDLRVAERRVAAAHARIGSALAEYYPRLTLSALAGVQSGSTGSLFSGEAGTLSGVVGLRWRLFDFGRIDAEVRAARGTEREALAAYRQSVLLAAEEVETALARALAGQARVEEHRRELAAADQARSLAEAAWRAGTISVAEVLEADRRRLQANDGLAIANGDRLTALIALHRALGA